MKALLLKDLYTLKSYKRILPVLVVFLLIFGFVSKDAGNIIPLGLMMCAMMCTIAVFSYDDMAKSDSYILALPIRRRDVVRSRYVLYLIFIAVAFVVGLLLSIIFQVVAGQPVVILDLLFFVTGGVIGLTLVMLLQLPFLYKYGAEKGRMFLFIAIAFLGFIGGGLILLLKQIASSFNLSLAFLEEIAHINSILLIGSILITFILYYVSYKISCRIYEKKEF